MSKFVLLVFFITLLITAGCENNPDSLVTFKLINTTFGPENIQIEAMDGLHIYQSKASDFGSFSSGYRSTVPLKTISSGEIDIHFEIYGDSPTPSVDGDLSIELRSDWHWTVDFVIAEQNPDQYCMGCFGSKAFALPAFMQRDDNDSLYVIWGGNSISNPVIY